MDNMAFRVVSRGRWSNPTNTYRTLVSFGTLHGFQKARGRHGDHVQAKVGGARGLVCCTQAEFWSLWHLRRGDLKSWLMAELESITTTHNVGNGEMQVRTKGGIRETRAR